MYQGLLHGWQRQHLQGDLCDHTQGTQGSGLQTGGVIARHILHYLATKLQVFAPTIDQPQAQHVVPHRALPGTARAGQVRGQGTADGVRVAKPRWLERQALIVLRQHRIDIRQAGPCPCGHHQLHRFITDNAGMLCQAQGLPPQATPEERLTAAAGDGQCCTRFSRLFNLFCQLLADITHDGPPLPVQRLAGAGGQWHGTPGIGEG